MIGRPPVQSIHGTLVPVGPVEAAWPAVLLLVSFDLLLFLGIEDLIGKVTVGPSDEVTSRSALVFDEDGFNTGHFDVTMDICVGKWPSSQLKCSEGDEDGNVLSFIDVVSRWATFLERREEWTDYSISVSFQTSWFLKSRVLKHLKTSGASPLGGVWIINEPFSDGHSSSGEFRHHQIPGFRLTAEWEDTWCHLHNGSQENVSGLQSAEVQQFSISSEYKPDPVCLWSSWWKQQAGSEKSQPPAGQVAQDGHEVVWCSWTFLESVCFKNTLKKTLVDSEDSFHGLTLHLGNSWLRLLHNQQFAASAMELVRSYCYMTGSKSY